MQHINYPSEQERDFPPFFCNSGEKNIEKLQTPRPWYYHINLQQMRNTVLQTYAVLDSFSVGNKDKKKI